MEVQKEENGTQLEHEEKRHEFWKQLKRHLKKLWIMERSRYIFLYSIIMMISFICIDFTAQNIIEGRISSKVAMVCTFFMWYVVPLLIVIGHYCYQKDIRDGLWVSVMEQCLIKEDYKKFSEIKKCIKNYIPVDDEQGAPDIITNINVVEAAIEREKTQSIIAPISITAYMALFFEDNSISLGIGFSLFLILGVMVILLELSEAMPRNAFIKKVVTSMKEEMAQQ